MGRTPIDRSPKSGFNSASEARLRALRKNAHGTASMDERVSFDSPEAMQAYIAAGCCPFCGKSFRNLAGHTNRTHGVSASELKDMAGLPHSYAVCSPEYSAKRSEIMKETQTPEIMNRMHAARKGGPRHISPGGRRVQSDKLRTYWEGREDAANMPWGEASRAAARTARHQAAQPRYDEIVARLKAGQLAKDIQTELGVSQSVVTAARNKAGLGDMRSMPQVRAEHARQTRTRHPDMIAPRLEKLDEQREQRLARWAELGSDWAAIGTLAGEWGVSRKTVASYLRKSGCEISDGRTSSPIRYRHPPSTRTCDVCGGPHLAKGLCEKHYRAAKRLGEKE